MLEIKDESENIINKEEMFEEFFPRKSIQSRYAQTKVSNRYYGTIQITGTSEDNSSYKDLFIPTTYNQDRGWVKHNKDGEFINNEGKKRL